MKFEVWNIYEPLTRKSYNTNMITCRLESKSYRAIIDWWDGMTLDYPNEMFYILEL